MLRLGDDLGEDVSGLHGVQLFLIGAEQIASPSWLPSPACSPAATGPSTSWRTASRCCSSKSALDEASPPCPASSRRRAAVPFDGLCAATLAFLARRRSSSAMSASDPRRTAPAMAHGGSPRRSHQRTPGQQERYLGQLAQLRGIPTALALFEEALRFNEQAGAVVWAAHSRADLALLHQKADGAIGGAAASSRSAGAGRAPRSAAGGVAGRYVVVP